MVQRCKTVWTNGMASRECWDVDTEEEPPSIITKEPRPSETISDDVVGRPFLFEDPALTTSPIADTPPITGAIIDVPPASPADPTEAGAGDVGAPDVIVNGVKPLRPADTLQAITAAAALGAALAPEGAPVIVPGVDSVIPVPTEQVAQSLGITLPSEEGPLDKALRALGLDPLAAKTAFKKAAIITAGIVMLPVIIPFAGRVIGSVIDAFQLAKGRTQRR